MLYGINYFVDQLHGDARYDPLRFGECALQSAQGYSRFLGGYPREQLGERPGQVSLSHWDCEEDRTEANAGRTTESKMVVSGNSASPFPFCPS